MNDLTPRQVRDRYVEDISFNKLVQYMLIFMEENKIQPYEVKDAAFMAELLYRERNLRPVHVVFNEDVR